MGKCETSLTDTIKRVALQTFPKRTATKSRDNNKYNAPTKNMSLLSYLFLSLQSRPDIDLDAFFKYTSQRDPSSLSDKGKLRSGKSLTITKVTSSDDITVIVLDAPAVVHMIRPTKDTDF